MKRFRYSDEERPFNMAAALLKRCDLLFLKANESSVIGDYGIWYRVLVALKRTISFKLDEKQEKEINDKLKEAGKSINQPTLPLHFEEELDKIETRIISLMYEYGLYYPKYEKKKWEDEAEGEDV